AVAAEDKVGARNNLRADFTTIPIIIRINAIGTPWHEDDLAAALAQNPSALLVPKADDSEAFKRLVARVSTQLPVIALVETARGIAGVRTIAALPSLTRIAFGSWDFCADLGCE